MFKISLFILLLTGISHTIPLEEFSFLLGNWELKKEGGKITEHWKKEGNRFLGSSYKQDSKGKRTLTETISLTLVKGEWNFVVTGYEKGNEGTTSFKLVSSKNNTFIFENPKHDFPQRIIYQPQGKNKLLAWVEGTMNEKKIKLDFPYNRQK